MSQNTSLSLICILLSAVMAGCGSQRAVEPKAAHTMTPSSGEMAEPAPAPTSEGMAGAPEAEAPAPAPTGGEVLADSAPASDMGGDMAGGAAAGEPAAGASPADKAAPAPRRRSGRRAVARSKPAPGATAPDTSARSRERRERPLEIAAEAPRRQRRAGQLTAGEWRDLDHWAFWRGLFDPQSRWVGMERHWGFDTAERIHVEVRSQGGPVIDARVLVRDARQQLVWQTRSDNQGRADLFPSLFAQAQGPFTVEARSGQSVARRDQVHALGNEPLVLELERAEQPANALDVMFVVDTTGSMGDELEYLKTELGWVISQAQAHNGQNLRVRTSVNFYRDRSDAYVVRPYGFERSIDRVLGQIRGQSAAGGGDFPEAVGAALANAIDGHDWSPNARARLLFLVLDAPPHHRPDVLQIVRRATRRAAEAGIHIIPVAGSGIDKPTEFLLRFLAVSTGGTYTFLTDHSGIGGSHIKPTIGPHDIERLNQLLVRVIDSYLS